jgi:SPP1 gp7 family putative phage head morphogenesis protein
VSVSRAKLIAKDQVNKFYGELNRERQRGLGIRKATWRTAADNRVRDEHEALNGTVYDLDNPPEGGPGQPVGCRCYDDPDLESVTEAEPEAPAEAEPEAENDPALTEPEAPNTVEGMTVAQTTQENLARAPEAFTAAGDRHLFSFKGGRFVLRGTR